MELFRPAEGNGDIRIFNPAGGISKAGGGHIGYEYLFLFEENFSGIVKNHPRKSG